MFLASEIWSLMMLCRGHRTNAIWSLSRSISTAITKAWKITLLPNPRQRGHRVHLIKKALQRAGRPSKLTGKSQSLSLVFRNNTSLATVLLLFCIGSWQSLDEADHLISANQYLASKIWTRHSKLKAMRADSFFNPQPQVLGEPAKIRMMFSVSQ